MLPELPRGWYHPEHVSQHPPLLLNRCHRMALSVPGPAGAASASTSTLARSLCAASRENELVWGLLFFFLPAFLLRNVRKLERKKERERKKGRKKKKGKEGMKGKKGRKKGKRKERKKERKE